MLAWAMLAVIAGLPTAASSQTNAAQPAMPELEEARSVLSRIQQYKSACDALHSAGTELRAPGNSLLSAFRNDKLFLTAIGHFCASGVFYLNGSSKDGCKGRHKLSEPQMEFLRKLSVVRVDAPARLIHLECADLPSSLDIKDFATGGLYLKDVSAERIFIALSKIPAGVRLEHVTVKNGVGLFALTVEAPIEIIDSEIGDNKKWDLGLGIQNSTIDLLLLSKGTKIGGKFSLASTKISGGLVVSDAKFASHVILSYLRSDRLNLRKSTFEKSVTAEYVHVQTEFSIEDETRIVGNFWGKHTHAADFRVDNTKFGGSITLSNAKMDSIQFANVSTIDPNCSNCAFRLWDASVLHFGYRKSSGLSVLAGNGAFRTFATSAAVIPKFDCSDCSVEQYMLLASNMTGRTALAGANIKGTLAFSEGDLRSCWTGSAVLDLSEVRVDAISANAPDFMLSKRPAGSEGDCTDASLPVATGGALVPTRLSGARFRAITPARLYRPDTVAPKHKPLPLIGLPSERLVELIKSGREAGLGEGYDPQPYEELADALARAGETRKARDLRIAKIDDRLANTETGFVLRAFYWSYRLISRYGFENERAALIFVGLLAIGMGVHLYGRRDVLIKLADLRAAGNLTGLVVYSLWFSLDRAIPPLHLDPHMHEMRGQHWSMQQYFYLHRVLGTYLISVFAAGAAGVGH